MAQLNPNFEIDFSDINSYEQIQLINDTQLAKENLLMHRAYKEPSDDEIIRNQFSSFTFVDFCPKLFNLKQSSLGADAADIDQMRVESGSQSLRYYELETFSDLFERINSWLKLNKDWRVVSMQTLIYDSSSQFNHLKSSIYSNYLPQNTRGLRLFLSPSKSRFSGPQKIGCINVVPRKVSGSHMKPNETIVYETLDEILHRLNDLLLTRPIEGRILSVETITLPMVDGYVNTESNYFLDSRLNLLNQCTYNLPNESAGTSAHLNCQTEPLSSIRGQHLIDILRVYYEFGPVVCGLVNLIDFIPRFYSSTPTDSPPADIESPDNFQHGDAFQRAAKHKPAEKMASTESLTRLIRRSLAWFESERKLVLNETASSQDHQGRENSVNLKVCNIQVHQKTLVKGRLTKINPNNAIESTYTRIMVHQLEPGDVSTLCVSCSSSPDMKQQAECGYCLELRQPYQMKFIRLAYVVPVYNKYVRSMFPLYNLRSHKKRNKPSSDLEAASEPRLASFPDRLLADSSPSLSSSSSSTSPTSSSRDSLPSMPEFSTKLDSRGKLEDLDELPQATLYDEQPVADLQEVGSTGESISNRNLWDKEAILDIVNKTNRRHRLYEEAHQLKINEEEPDALIGQLTYRLFAPCQLVKSSSCFSINPVNSSSPLARRGSVNLNGSGISSENAHPATSLLASSPTPDSPISIGSIFPVLSQTIISGSSDSGAKVKSSQAGCSRFTNNEFEPVEAIRRRMEIYVTTNSMKVIAGETLVVNLSDTLSCLSTAIEQTVVKAPFGQHRSTTWVSVYMLYAAVDEPQLPSHLLAQQKLRELTLISEEANEEEKSRARRSKESSSTDLRRDELAEGQHDNSATIRIEQNPVDSSLILYNSAYDRTVALPTQPDNHLDDLEPFEFKTDCLMSKDCDLFDSQQVITIENRKRRKRKSKRKHRDDSQCSIM